MALVIRVGYFATGGHTEVGGLQRFLDRIDARASMWRCFPAITKPGPKLGRPAPDPDDEGITGGDLVARMLRRLEKYHRPGMRDALDIVVLVDDVDCRFAIGDRSFDPEQFGAWLVATTERVRAAAQKPDLPFIALLGCPEIEAWFVADGRKASAASMLALPSGIARCDPRSKKRLGSPSARSSPSAAASSTAVVLTS